MSAFIYDLKILFLVAVALVPVVLFCRILWEIAVNLWQERLQIAKKTRKIMDKMVVLAKKLYKKVRK